jgi:hypothetical protein
MILRTLALRGEGRTNFIHEDTHHPGCGLSRRATTKGHIHVRDNIERGCSRCTVNKTSECPFIMFLLCVFAY